MKSFVRKSAKERGAMQTLYFNPEQTNELLSIGGDAALVLMQHYVAIAHQPNPNMEDAVLAVILNRSVSAVKKVRLSLTAANWFKRVKTTVKGETHVMYTVGKQAVNAYNSGKTAVLNTNKECTSDE